jgi:hypothetical protein
MIKQIAGKIAKKIKKDNEIGARHQLLNDLFDDFHRSRYQVYSMNFFRGVFFGFGTVIGGTVIVALMIWVLNQFVDWFPLIGEYLKLVIGAMRAGK